MLLQHKLRLLSWIGPSHCSKPPGRPPRELEPELEAAEFLLGRAPPASHLALPMVGDGTRGHDATLEKALGLLSLLERLQRHPQTVEPLGVVGPVLDEALEHAARVLEGPGRDVYRACLAHGPERGVLGIACEYRFQMTDRVLPATLLTCDAGELE